MSDATTNLNWDWLFDRPIACVQSPCVHPADAAAPTLPGDADHSVWIAARDARLRAAEAKHAAAAGAGGLAPTLLERVLVTAKNTIEQSGAEAAVKDVVATVASVPAKLAEAVPQLGMPIGLAIAGMGVLALVLVLRR